MVNSAKTELQVQKELDKKRFLTSAPHGRGATRYTETEEYRRVMDYFFSSEFPLTTTMSSIIFPDSDDDALRDKETPVHWASSSSRHLPSSLSGRPTVLVCSQTYVESEIVSNITTMLYNYSAPV